MIRNDAILRPEIKKNCYYFPSSAGGMEIPIHFYLFHFDDFPERELSRGRGASSLETVPEGDSSSRLNRPRLLLLVMSTVTWTCSVTATCREKRIQYKCSAPEHRDVNILCITAGSCPRCRGGGGPLVHTVNLKTEMTTRTLKTKKILMTILSSSLHIFHYDYQADAVPFYQVPVASAQTTM